MEQNWLNQVKIFNGLKTREYAELSKIIKEKKFPADTLIFSQGEESTELYILKKGSVDIRIKIALQLADTLVYTVKENEVFGEFSFIAPGPRSASAICTTDTVVAVIKSEDFEELIKYFPNIGLQFYRNIAHSLIVKLKKTNDLLRDTLIRSAGLEV